MQYFVCRLSYITHLHVHIECVFVYFEHITLKHTLKHNLNFVLELSQRMTLLWLHSAQLIWVSLTELSERVRKNSSHSLQEKTLKLSIEELYFEF